METFGDRSILRSFVSQGYEKSLKDVFYNFLALLLTIVFSFTLWGVYIILQPFFKPLFWALLCGSVLHPFKYALTSRFKKWIVSMESTSLKVPFIVRIVTSPIKLIFNFSTLIGDLFLKHLIPIIGSVIGILLLGVIYNYTPQFFIYSSFRILQTVICLFNTVVHICEKTTVVGTIVLGFVLALHFCWKPHLNSTFSYLSGFVWFSLTCHISGYFYYIRWPVFFLFQLLYLIGIGYNWWDDRKDTGLHKNITRYFYNSLVPSIVKVWMTTLTSSGTGIRSVSKAKEVYSPPRDSSTPLPETLGDFEDTKDTEITEHEATREWPLYQIWQYASDNTSDIYIYWVTIACIVTLVLKSGWLPYVAALLLTLFGVGHFCAYFGITDFLQTQYENFIAWLIDWYNDREDAIVPGPIKGMIMVCSMFKFRTLEIVRESSDSAATVMVILGLLVFVSFATTFLAIQAYTEGVYMMKVGGSVINETVVHNPDLKQLLPEGWEQKVDLALNNAYMYGREYLSKLVRNMLVGVKEEKAAELEKRALELWDRVYQAWMMNALEQKTVGPKVTASAVYQTWDHFVDGFQKTPELMNMKTVNKLLHNNMATLMSGLESLWDIIKGNASLLMHTVTTILSVVFSHGFAVLNFIINMIVFLTALFYLLSSSRQLYKPVEMACSISPNYGQRLALAFETAVNEVLTASFKLAVFYGMWTWLIHTVFQMNIVYIPSVFAAILAVIPALGTYWACLPAVLDLWVAQGKSFQAIALACFQFLPTTIVDVTIYKEIHGGHPYLTGLSVAGGLFCLGMEGAIIGPLVLCGLYVVLNLSTDLFHDSPKAWAEYPSTSAISGFVCPPL